MRRLLSGLLPDCGVVTPEIVRKSEHPERVDDPLRGIEIVPLRSVAKIARVGMVKIMIALAKTDKGDQPAVAAAVLRPVRLGPHHVAERIDREGGVQHHEHPEETSQEEGADTTL